MFRPWKIWSVFAASGVVLLCVIGWASWMTLRLDRAQTEARAQAEVEESVRLALWRMDSMLAPLIAQESARPYFAYHAFHSANRAYGRMFNPFGPGDVLIPSPLLTQTPTNVVLYFQFDPEGRLTSPQVPEGNQRALAEAQFATRERVEAAAARLREFERIMNEDAAPETARAAVEVAAGSALSGVSSLEESSPKKNRDMLLRAAPASEPKSNVLAGNTGVWRQLDEMQRETGQPSARNLQQLSRNAGELQARAQSVQQAYDFNLLNYANVTAGPLDRNEVVEDVLRPVWFGNHLILARRVSVQGRDYVQGCWLDWPAMKGWLLDGVNDLLPSADLELLNTRGDDPQARMLATLPVRLLPGPPLSGVENEASPLLLALALAWACVLVAGLAVALLLQGTVSLSERRAAFVSAVTHELRTPLTTFKMYSEMLADGMIPDETRRREYLSGLCAEANRLNHLVENVLAYARLERGNPRRRVEKVTLRKLIECVRPRLVQRAEQAGMTLQEDAAGGALDTLVQVDVSAVEQILFNLVDNACKYGAPAADEKVIHLEAFPENGRFALLRVRDHGRGISADAAKRLFHPFSKSADEAAKTAPGVGLGLALCRRLGRSLGGDLRFNASARGKGACFELLLPVVG
jgi:signal transduction histidine kinase